MWGRENLTGKMGNLIRGKEVLTLGEVVSRLRMIVSKVPREV